MRLKVLLKFFRNLLLRLVKPPIVAVLFGGYVDIYGNVLVHSISHADEYSEDKIRFLEALDRFAEIRTPLKYRTMRLSDVEQFLSTYTNATVLIGYSAGALSLALLAEKFKQPLILIGYSDDVYQRYAGREVKTFTNKVLFISGEKDEHLTEAKLLAARTNSTFVVLKGAGHDVFDSPELIPIVTKFVLASNNV